jgi:hypothetical protein
LFTLQVLKLCHPSNVVLRAGAECLDSWSFFVGMCAVA